jgi:hypothetical protein
MTDAPSSAVIEHFVKQLSADMPESEKVKLGAYEAAIAATTADGDLRRAWHCAGWAVQLAEEPGGSHLGHLVAELRAAHQLWEDTILGIGFGRMTPEGKQLDKDGIGPVDDVEIQWVDGAVAVANAQAEASGWDSVPWEDLLRELLAVGTS